jgi:hypothetical protein
MTSEAAEWIVTHLPERLWWPLGKRRSSHIDGWSALEMNLSVVRPV